MLPGRAKMKKSPFDTVRLAGCAFIVTTALAIFLPVAAEAQWETAFVSVEKSRMYPVRGQSRGQVQQQYGEPEQEKFAVGEPPISSWQYPGFVVYFEHDLVITSVASEDTLPPELGDIQ